MKKKRAEEDIVLSSMVFIILTVVFFSAMFFFIHDKSSQKSTYEQAYAKQIALLIDFAKPVMNISINISKLIAIAEKNNYKKEDIVKINPDKNEVVVMLSGRGGYAKKYFSEYDVRTYIKDEFLIITVNEKEEENA